MAFKPIDLSVFPQEREAGLKNLYRYSRFELMYYRSNLWMHSWRMLWLIEALAPLAQKYLQDIDIEKARILALVHDDAELLFGDINAGVKALMSVQELDAVEKAEEDAIEEIAKIYPKEVHGYNYKELLTSFLSSKSTIEAKFVSYVDKLDGLCESMHEILAGNVSSLEAVTFGMNARALFPYKFPVLAAFLDDRTSPLVYTDNRTWRDNVAASLYADLFPYTEASIRATTAFPFYDEWKRIVIERGGEEGMRWLIEQKEHKMA